MPRASPAQTAFNAGELSPRMEGRVDIAKYQNGCKTLQNFLPTVQGPAIKRSGTRYVKDVKTVSAVTRLVPFEFGTTQAYVLEFGNQYVRVYKDSGGVLESTVAINAVAATTPIGITTGAAHGYATGDQVYISGSAVAGINSSYFRITWTGANTFTLDGTASLGAGGAAGTVARVHEFATPYTTAQLSALSFAQSADVLYIAHPDHEPRKLSRTGHTTWTLEVIDFDWQPFAPENLDEDQYVVASAVEGTGISLWSPDGIFTADHVGGYFRMRETLEAYAPEWKPGITFGSAPDIYEPFGIPMNVGGRCWYEGNVYELVSKNGSTGSSAPIHTDGTRSDGQWFWKYLHSGAGYVEITALVSATKVTATVVKRLPDSTVLAPKSISVIANTTPIRITTSTSHTLSTGDLIWIEGSLLAGINDQTFTVTRVNATQIDLDGTAAGGAFGAGGSVVRIRSADTAPSASADFYARPNLWSFGAWSDARGYPSSVTFFEDRLWWAGSSADPQALWGSRTSRYEDHETLDQDDGALVLVLNTQQVNQIQWLSAGRVLAIGTAGGEFVLEGVNGGPVTAGNAKADQHSFYGVRANVAPLRVENVTLFPQRAGRKLIEFGFDYDSNGYLGADLSVLSHHVTLGQIKALAWAQEPDRIVWAVLEDGGLIGMTYDRAQEVVGWHRHVIGGASVAVESVAVIPHPDGDRDQVWLIVKRTVNGGVTRHVEFFEAAWLHGTAIEDAFFVDAGLTYDGAPASTITGLWHLLNTSVEVLADGIARTGLTVSATTGQLTLPSSASVVQVGLAYTAELETMRVEAGAADGTAQGKTKRTTNAVLRLDDTGEGLEYGVRGDVYDTYAITPGTLASGDTEILPWPGGYEQAGRHALRHSKPTPCTITAIFPQVVTEDR